MPTETADTPIGRDVVFLHDLSSSLLADTRDGLQQIGYPDMSENIVLGALIECIGQGLRAIANCILQCSACPAGFGSCGPSGL